MPQSYQNRDIEQNSLGYTAEDVRIIKRLASIIAREVGNRNPHATAFLREAMN